MKDRIAKAEGRIDQLRKKATTTGADALAKRVETTNDRLTKLEARVDTLIKRISEHCADANATANPNASSSPTP